MQCYSNVGPVIKPHCISLSCLPASCMYAQPAFHGNMFCRGVTGLTNDLIMPSRSPKTVPSKYAMASLCWFNAGPASQSLLFAGYHPPNSQHIHCSWLSGETTSCTHRPTIKQDTRQTFLFVCRVA